MASSFKITGIREVRAALRALDAKALRRMAGAMEGAMEPVRREVLSQVPRRSGALAAHVERVTTTSRGRVQVDVAIDRDRSGPDYAGFVELGAAAHHQEAEHFMLRAFDLEAASAARAAGALIAGGIEREAGP